MTSSRRIMSVDGGEVVFQYVDLSRPDQRPLPPTATVAGMLVIGGEGSARRIDYPDDPLATIERLAIGETTRIAARETSTLRDHRRTIDLTTTVSYLACGTLPVEGRPIPVRVYRVVSGRRVIGPDLRERIRQSLVDYYLAEPFGYPIAIADPGATGVVEEIAPPPWR